MRSLQNRPFSGFCHWACSAAIIFSCLFLSCSNPDDDLVPDDNQNNDQDQMDDDKSGKAAPEFELTALSGSKIKLSDYKDKVVVLFFLGSSCPLCKAAAPSVEKELKEAYAGNADYVILGLDTWDGNNSAMQSFKDVTKVTFPLLLNASAVAKDYDTTYDRLVVINKTGNISHSGTRATTNDISTVKTKVDELLKDM